MKCHVIQRCLLGLEGPAHPPAGVQAHLATCPVCRAWHQRLVQIERQVPLLEVPAATSQGEFLRQFLDGATAPQVPSAATLPLAERQTPGELGWRIRERGMRKLALAAALAAGLLLFAFGWWAWQQAGQAPEPETPERKIALLPDEIGPRVEISGPSLERVVERHKARSTKLEMARTPHERVVGLADVARILLKDASRLQHGADVERLLEVKRDFVELVRDGIPAQALLVPAADRARLLPAIIEELARVQSDAELLADEMANEKGKTALRQMAQAARMTQDELHKLA